MWMSQKIMTGVVLSFFLSAPTVIAVQKPEGKEAGKRDSLKLERAREFLKWGNQYQEKGLTEKAREYWKIALELDPDLSEAHENLGTSDLAEGNNPNLSMDREPLSENLETDSERPYGKLVKNLFDRAMTQYRKKEYEEALRSLDQAQKLDPSNRLLQNLRKRVEADYSDTLLGKQLQEARVQWREGNGEEALRILKSILRDHPKYRPAVDLLDEMGNASQNEREKKIRPILQKAQKAEKDNRFMEAQAHYDAILKVDPQNKDAAAGSERMARLIDPLRKKTRDLESALKAGNKKKAEADLAEIQELSPNHPKLASWKEKIKELSGNGVPEDSQAKADTAYNLGLESYRKGDLASAKKFWTQALELNPQSTQARRNIDRLSREHPELK
jgi:tetratricopeptide (TPR) repeat protein